MAGRIGRAVKGVGLHLLPFETVGSNPIEGMDIRLSWVLCFVK